jgi:hypothetical protein
MGGIDDLARALEQPNKRKQAEAIAQFVREAIAEAFEAEALEDDEDDDRDEAEAEASGA